ncbi:MAG TPA: hypothetical protein PLV52_02565 [Candidatus Omnitrophota bacterium]|nr:hypothetical protein [Candidatus Omnitrophota bacterium]
MEFVFVKFLVCASVIFYFGKRVARYGDAIAEKTGLGGLWIGVILVSIATSLPELFTGVGSTLFVDAPDLTVGNIFGANSYNLFNIATLDLLHKGGPLLSSVSSGQLLTAAFSLIPLSIAAMGIFLTPKLANTSIFNLSVFSIMIFLSYIICTKTIYNFEKRRKIIKELREEEEVVLKYDDITLRTACIRYAFSAFAIAAAGIWLAYIGDDLAAALNLGRNFIGSLFLGFATTLPEITVSIAALRLGAKEMAVANMVGSNLFNVTIIFINDILYRKAPIFEMLSQQHIFNVFLVIAMTAIIMAGMVIKPKDKTRMGLSNYAIWLVVVFVVGAYINFILGGK